MKNLIITAIDKNYEWNFIHDFLMSLAKVYKGQIAVVDYGLSAEMKKDALKFNVFLRDAPLLKEVVNMRLKDFSDLLELEMFQDVTHVMMVDSGDVWFQEPFEEIFDLCKEHIGHVRASDDNSHHWMNFVSNDIRNQTTRKKVIDKLCDRREGIVDAGMVCGPKDKVIDLLRRTFEFVEEMETDCFGMDMVAMDYLVRSSSETFVNLPDTYNYSMIRHAEYLLYKENSVYDKNKIKVKIAHNSGGDSKLRYVDRKKCHASL